LVFVWGILFAMIRAGVVGPNHWMYEKTKWIPGLGENSLARTAATPADGTSSGGGGSGGGSGSSSSGGVV
jgi:hypothetical protein